jgi:diaminopimelate epimerase
MFKKIEKWHGCKNDFIVIWISQAEGDVVLDSLRRLAPGLCRRDGSGIGADGILVLQSKLKTSLFPESLTIINSDGSIAGNCGNGIRCAATSIRRRNLTEGNGEEFPEAIELTVAGRQIICRFLDEGQKIDQGFVAVEMGIAAIGSENPWHPDAKKEVARVGNDLGIPGLGHEFNTCEIGNRHLVFFLEDADRAQALKVGPALQKSAFWDGINVHLCRAVSPTAEDHALAKKILGGKISELYRVFVWERGAGETQACGSGACAVAAASFATGLVDRNDWIAIDMPGGRLYCKQDEAGAPVTLAGPAQFVFEGLLEI